MSSGEGAQYDPGPGGGAALNRGARGLAQKIKDWTDGRIAAAIAGRSGLTSLKINGAEIGLRQHLDVQMAGATGEDHPELDLARVVLPSGGGSPLGAMVWADTNQNIAPFVDTALIFQRADWDTDSCWNVSTPTVLTCHTAGVYAVVGYAQLVVSAAGTNFNLELIVQFQRTTTGGGWVPIARNSVGLPPVDNPACTVTAPPRAFLVGDQVRLRLDHTSTVTEHTAVSTYATGTKPVEPPQLAFWKIG